MLPLILKRIEVRDPKVYRLRASNYVDVFRMYLKVNSAQGEEPMNTAHRLVTDDYLARGIIRLVADDKVKGTKPRLIPISTMEVEERPKLENLYEGMNFFRWIYYSKLILPLSVDVSDEDCAQMLNTEGVPKPAGRRVWNAGAILALRKTLHAEFLGEYRDFPVKPLVRLLRAK